MFVVMLEVFSWSWINFIVTAKEYVEYLPEKREHFGDSVTKKCFD